MPWRGGTHIARSHRAEAYVKRFKRLAAAVYRDTAKEFQARSIDSATPDDLLHHLNHALAAVHPRWIAWHRRCYVLTGAAFARDSQPRKRRAAADDWSKPPTNDFWINEVLPQLGPEEWWAPWLVATLRYVDSESAKNIRGIDEATRRGIQSEIARGIESGAGIAEVRDRVDRLLRSDYTTVRAERIARTEVPTAARAGTYEAARLVAPTGGLTKSWLDSGDARTRQTHAQATLENVGIPFEQPFRVRSEQTGAEQLLRFPGDTSLGADASTVVNCRCDVLIDLA